MPFTVLIYTALALSFFNMILVILLWRRVSDTKRQLRQSNATVQRHEREIAQHRYSLAILRQMLDTQSSDDKSDEEWLKAAVEQLDQIPGAPEPTTVTPSAIPAEALGKLKDGEILQFVRKAIKNNQIAISRQPIVTLPKREVRYYEIFSRILVGDEGYIPAGKFISVAQSNNLIAMLDNILLLRCLQIIKQSANNDPSISYFVNISPQTLGSKTYINDLIDFLQANPKLSSRLIFEIRQEESLKLTPTVKSVIENLALLGCRFSMDQVTIYGMDVDRLVDHNISFVKLDTRALEKEMSGASARGRIKRIKTGLDSQGIQVIAEKIENEKQLLGILDLYVDYGQGYLFGQPELMG